MPSWKWAAAASIARAVGIRIVFKSHAAQEELPVATTAATSRTTLAAAAIARR
jgi:hypothetical protein